MQIYIFQSMVENSQIAPTLCFVSYQVCFIRPTPENRRLSPTPEVILKVVFTMFYKTGLKVNKYLECYIFFPHYILIYIYILIK